MFLVIEVREGVAFDAWECKDQESQVKMFIEVCETEGNPADSIDIDNGYKALKQGQGTICMIKTRQMNPK